MRLCRAALLLAALSTSGCLAYEYEHEFWLKVDGSGRVHVTGQPWLWKKFKGLDVSAESDSAAAREAARGLFERSGLRVRRVTWTRREGRPYLFVAAEFADVSRLPGTPDFPDLDIKLVRTDDRLRLEGTWRDRGGSTVGGDPFGLMAVRFHLPSKVYEHHNAAEGVERGNIVAWRQDVAAGVRGQALPFGAVMDNRSILWSTVGLFATAIALALTTLGAALFLAFRRGRGTAAAEPATRS